MDTDQLRTFVEVSRTRHFGRAARNLFITQSAVSSRIKSLEAQLGTPLFIRNRNDISLTPAGNRLLAHAENILAAWNRAKHDVSIEDEATASLAIAGTPSLWDISLQDWIHDLRNTYSEVAIHAEVLDTDPMLHRLLEGTLDIGFTFEPPQVPHIEIRQIATVPLIMVSNIPNVLVSDALAQNYILVDWGMSFSIHHSRFFPDITMPNIRLPLGRIALEYILNCGGAAYLAEPMVSAAIEQEVLFKVTDAPAIERPTHALFSSNSDQFDTIQKALSLFS